MTNNFDAAVIGAGGFIGTNLVTALKAKNISTFEINRQTPSDRIKENTFHTVFFCAGNSKTFVSKNDPLRCLQENVLALYDYLTELYYQKFVYLSSIIVYPQTSMVRTEELPIDISQLSIYGSHKYLGERYVKEFAKTWLIVRPTGFFGKGLKKNLLFDLRNNRPDIYVKRSSWIDYMPVGWFCDVLSELSAKAENEIINVGSGQPIAVRKLLEKKNIAYKFHEERLQDDRNISFVKLRHYFPQSITSDEIETMIEEFLLVG